MLTEGVEKKDVMPKKEDCSINAEVLDTVIEVEHYLPQKLSGQDQEQV